MLSGSTPELRALVHGWPRGGPQRSEDTPSGAALSAALISKEPESAVRSGRSGRSGRSVGQVWQVCRQDGRQLVRRFAPDRCFVIRAVTARGPQQAVSSSPLDPFVRRLFYGEPQELALGQRSMPRKVNDGV